jgi:putative ABC transport system substrate-binding protein
MRRKICSLALGLWLLALSSPTEAQRFKVYRVGLLTLGTADRPEIKGIRDGLKKAGYLAGKNLLLDIQVKRKYDELRPVAEAYGQKKIDAIITIGDRATSIAKEATHGIPIIFVGSTDPVRSGLVKSLAHPGTAVTGFTYFTDVEMQGERLEVFNDTVPELRRLVVLYNARPDAPHHAISLAVVQKVAQNLRIRVLEKPIKSSADAPQALSLVSKENADGIFLICSGLFRDSYSQTASLSIQKKLPLWGCNAQQVAEYGALLSYDTDRYSVGHRAARYVGRILKGVAPQDLAVETPTKFELVINLKTAKQIGVTIPQSMLYRADRVIK